MCEVGLCGPGSCDPQILELILLPAGKDAAPGTPLQWKGRSASAAGLAAGIFMGCKAEGLWERALAPAGTASAPQLQEPPSTLPRG